LVLNTPRSAFSRVLPAIIGTLAAQVYLWPHITDDAYITFRYAWNLASGNGLVFNPGEQVEGFSNPLWTLLLAVTHVLTAGEIPTIARVCGISFSIGILILTHRFVGRIGGLHAANLALLLIVLNPGFHVYASAGLEGPLLSLLLLSSLALSRMSSSRMRVFAAVLPGLAGITRPEGPAYVLLWFLATLDPGTSLVAIFKRERIRLFVLLLPIVAWQVFRVAYYGSWLPNTAVAKVPGVFGEFINFPEYITPWLIAAGGPLFLLLWLILPPKDSRIRTIERVAFGIVGANLIFIAYAQGDWMPFGRFITPVWPVIAVAMSLWISSALAQLPRGADIRFHNMVAFTPVIGIVLCSFLAWQSSVRAYVDNQGMSMLMRGTDQIAVGEWINQNIAQTATVATGRLGGIGYGARNHVVWDWFGLTDAEEAAHIRRGRPGSITDDPVFRRKPDVIAAVEAPADWSYTRTSSLMDFLKENYIFVMGFPQGNYGYVDIWIRKDKIDEVLVERSTFIL
jgi:arabinofuranosyltransferase